MDESEGMDEMVRRAVSGDSQALATLFTIHQERLERMVCLRLDPRLRGRIDPGDVLQEAFIEASERVGEYARETKVSLFVWLRGLTGQKLVDLTRHHLGTKMRSAGKEVSFDRGGVPEASTDSLVLHLLGRLNSPSQAAIRAETRLVIQEALNAMDPIDREILTLRHFELLSNLETSQSLGLSPAAASTRHLRAIRRLKAILDAIPEFADVVKNL